MQQPRLAGAGVETRNRSLGLPRVLREADAAPASTAYRATMQRAIALPRSYLGRIHWNQDYADVVMAVALTTLAIIGMGVNHIEINPISVTLLILQTSPIAWRRRNPMRVLWVTGTAITVYSLLGYHDSSAGSGVFVAFYTVAANEPRRRATIAAVITAGGIFTSFAAYAAIDSMTGWTANLTVTYLSFGLAWLIGDNLRVRRAYTRQLEGRAVELVHEREERAALAVADERARIARELHDVVAHHVSVMVVQSAGARRVLDVDPALARQALEAVEAAGRTALAEMRRMLEVLRTDDSGVGPQPGLGELDRLISQVREAGLPVELKMEGTVRELPVGMDLAAYRIVQEALTNAVKHAGKATAQVAVRFAPETLEIEIVDDGRGAAAPLLDGGGGGHGLIGMRERVSLYGGELKAGPVFGGGYRVWATFQLDPEPRGSLATCCDEKSALTEVAAAAERDRAERADRSPRRTTGREQLVKPRVVPPMIGRVVPPHRAPSPHRDGGSRSRKSEQ